MATLRAVASPRRATVVAPRPLPADVARELERLSYALDPAFFLEGITRDASQVSALYARFPAGPLRSWLARDAASLLAAYLALTGMPEARVRLAVVERDACRRFHVDQVGLRLLCTYAGPGTELLQRPLPDPRVLRAKGELEAFNARVIEAGGGLRRAQAGDVVLLKGERWPGNAGRGAVHRSPPVVDLGLRRLVLRIDDGGAGARACPPLPALPDGAVPCAPVAALPHDGPVSCPEEA